MTYTTELLWLASSWVRNEKGSVVADEGFPEFKRSCGVVVFASVGNNGSGECLSDSVDLRSVSTTVDTDLDVDGLEGVASCRGCCASNADQKWFVDLHSHNFRFDKVERDAVDADVAFASFAEGDSGGRLIQASRHKSRFPSISLA